MQRHFINRTGIDPDEKEKRFRIKDTGQWEEILHAALFLTVKHPAGFTNPLAKEE